ncbi:uncharacterized protein N7500_007948 [Penicillium coprophilum]|uniref:uncharacterized protein n=1 Tax=Penicillium coprophilum TaxID=36646 RepID=UPI00239D87C2|nr:uncharacterized protein N7500_007948 [Penicillium coprophilum]KAJ5158297.1 hypothetical protein N7500_007948 [Penicillium coprophilum]
MVTTRKRKNISPDPEAFEAGPSSAPHRTSPTFVQSLSDTSAPVSVDHTNEPDWDTLTSQAKARLDEYVLSHDRTDRLLVPTLHALLVWLPQAGQEKIARDILSDQSTTDEGLYGVYDHIRTALLLPMKALGAKSYPVSSPISHRQEDAQTMSDRASTPVSRSDWFVDACLRRDDSRCVVSRYLASSKWKERGKPQQEVPIDLEVVHIVPFSFGKFERKQSAPRSAQSSPMPPEKESSPPIDQILIRSYNKEHGQ